MSQPPPLPPDRPEPLPYASPPTTTTLSVSTQALLGCAGVIGAMILAGFVIAGLAGVMVHLGDSWLIGMVAVASLTFVGGGLYLARRLRRNTPYRGWAIGIYIGAGSVEETGYVYMGEVTEADTRLGGDRRA